MTDHAWKQRERKNARWFGHEREPGSGAHATEANDRTESDSQHPRLFIETKLGKRQLGTVNVYRKAREQAKDEGKVPLVMLSVAHMKGALILLHQDDLLAVAEERRRAVAEECIRDAMKEDE